MPLEPNLRSLFENEQAGIRLALILSFGPKAAGTQLKVSTECQQSAARLP